MSVLYELFRLHSLDLTFLEAATGSGVVAYLPGVATTFATTLAEVRESEIVKVAFPGQTQPVRIHLNRELVAGPQEWYDTTTTGAADHIGAIYFCSTANHINANASVLNLQMTCDIEFKGSSAPTALDSLAVVRDLAYLPEPERASLRRYLAQKKQVAKQDDEKDSDFVPVHHPKGSPSTVKINTEGPVPWSS